MGRIESAGTLQLQDHSTLDKEVGPKVSNLMIPKPYSDGSLAHYSQPARDQSNGQRFLIDRFQKPVSQLVVNVEEDPNDLLGKLPRF